MVITSYDEITSVIAALIIIAIIAKIIAPFNDTVNKYIKAYQFRLFSYYSICILLSGLVIGCAELIALNTEIAARVKITMVIGANALGVIILLFTILMHVFVIQKRNLKLSNAYIQECMEEQTGQYEMIATKNEDLKRFRHDYNSHLHSLKRIADRGDMAVMKNYLEGLEDMKKSFDFISTNNIIADAVINEYYVKCTTEGIEFQVIGCFSDHLTVSNIDLCVLLSNGVKNAYEAVRECENEKSISVEIMNYKKRIIVTIKNTVNSGKNMKTGIMPTSKKNKENHGFGMRNMQDIAKKYGGEVMWQYDDKTGFMTKIEI